MKNLVDIRTADTDMLRVHEILRYAQDDKQGDDIITFVIPNKRSAVKNLAGMEREFCSIG